MTSTNRRPAERRSLTCEICTNEFVTTADHGVWPRFCSRDCFRNQGFPAKEKTCTTCGSLFISKRSSHKSNDGYRQYCSRLCRHKALKRGNEHLCLNCKTPFYLNPSSLQQRGDKPGCCSKECAAAFYTGARNPFFKGGFYTHTQAGEKHLLLPRPSHIGRYVGEHRVVAGQEIGRMPTREEPVIRINRNPKDNRPANLFICGSRSEHARRRQGSLPWPEKSNLAEYAAKLTPPASLQLHVPPTSKELS